MVEEIDIYTDNERSFKFVCICAQVCALVQPRKDSQTVYKACGHVDSTVGPRTNQDQQTSAAPLRYQDRHVVKEFRTGMS